MILHFDSDDSPTRHGYMPKDGEKRWTLSIPLQNGDTIALHIGQQTHDSLISILVEEKIDDVLEEVLDGKSSNDNQTPA